MLDLFKREITYLRISVTDKCNLRCIYCMPKEGIPLKKHSDFLTFEQIRDIAAAGASLGITKVRLTGGEPLVRREIVNLVSLISNIPQINHIGMTTNGLLLKSRIEDLKKAGLSSINISLDTLDPRRYEKITRGGDISRVLSAIKAATASGLPLKINMVILEDTSGDEIDKMKSFCMTNSIGLQFIGQYNLFENKRDAYTFDRPPDCARCNRVRLLAGGFLKPCLHSDIEVPVNFKDIKGSIEKAILSKPHRGVTCTSRNMIEIGG